MSTMLVLAERNVPGYTYPTAPHFSAIVGPQTYQAWLAELPQAATLSLYLHVPYCTELCLYCGCTTKAVRRRAPVETYAAHLLKEIELLGSAIGGRRVAHLHWGGGTPSILGPDSLRDLTERIAGVFDLTAIVEHAIELDPRRVTPKLAGALGCIGVTRVSFGVQDFSRHVQEAIGSRGIFAQRQHGFNPPTVGCPNRPDMNHPAGRGRYQQFTNGSMAWSPDTGPRSAQVGYYDRAAQEIVFDSAFTIPFSYDFIIVRVYKDGALFTEWEDHGGPPHHEGVGWRSQTAPPPGRYLIIMKGCDDTTFGSNCNQPWSNPVSVDVR
jgi:hypothetical protein